MVLARYQGRQILVRDKSRFEVKILVIIIHAFVGR